jgi:hypothetical protein
MTKYRIVKDCGAYYIEYKDWSTLWIWCQRPYDYNTFEDAKQSLDTLLNGKGKEVLYETK